MVWQGRKLQRERRVLERQAKALLKVPDRKEREELDGVKAELAAARKELQVRDARWKMTAERLKKTAQTAEAKAAEVCNWPAPALSPSLHRPHSSGLPQLGCMQALTTALYAPPAPHLRPPPGGLHAGAHHGALCSTGPAAPHSSPQLRPPLRSRAAPTSHTDPMVSAVG